MPTTNTETTHRTAALIGDQCLAVRVRMLNRTITTIYDDALRPLGLTVGQLNILVVIARRGPVSPGDHLILLAKVTEIRTRRAVFDCQAAVDGRMVFQGVITGMAV